MWTMFQNLRHDAAVFKPTELEPTNSAQELLTGLLNNETFRNVIKSVSTGLLREDIVTEIDATPIKPSARDTMANGLVQAAAAGDSDMLADLTKTPETPILSLEQLEKFWNADALISKEDPDLHTHIQADPRYVAFFDQYVAAKQMSGDAVTKLRAEIVAKHEAAVKTLDTIPYDGIQMALVGSSNDFYHLSAKGDFAALGYTDTAPNTVFSGLKVAEPLSAAELTRVTAPLNHVVVQAEKDRAAAEKDRIVAPDAIDPTKLTKDQIIAGLKDLQANEGMVTIDTYKQGFVLLNPAYKDFFDAVDASGGVITNPLRDQLEKALNENPDVLKSMIDISGDTSKIEALTASIKTEGGSTDLVLALAKANGTAPLDGPKVADAKDIITGTDPKDGVVTDPERTPGDRHPGGVIRLSEPFIASATGVVDRKETVVEDDLDAAEVRLPITKDDADPEKREVAPAEEDPNKYTVKDGDSLWKIAKEKYGLTSYKDIMRAVDHIAVANGLEKGTDANWIRTGAEINLPTAEQIAGPVKPLDWKALASDPKLGASARLALGG